MYLSFKMKWFSLLEGEMVYDYLTMILSGNLI